MGYEPVKVLTIGGGTGHFVLLSALKTLSKIEIKAIVSMMDNGGSTGRLRHERGVLPPGDVLKCVMALSPLDARLQRIFLRRFQVSQRLRGHNAGNMLLTILSEYTGSFAEGIAALAEILEVRGHILPVTTDRATLVAELANGRHIYGEQAIDLPQEKQRAQIRHIFLVPHHGDTIAAYPPALNAIQQAEVIIIGPGDLYTSLMPNLIVPGIREALQKTQAMLMFVVNIMTKYGETQYFDCQDFVSKLEACMGRRLDTILYNTRRPAPHILQKYHRQQSDFVEIHDQTDWLENRRLYRADLLDTAASMVRHDASKLANLIENILMEETIWR